MILSNKTTLFAWNNRHKFVCNINAFERSQNIGPFQLSATLKQGAPLEVTDTRPPNPLTNDTCRRYIFKELHSTVQESLKLESESLELELGAVLPNK